MWRSEANRIMKDPYFHKPGEGLLLSPSVIWSPPAEAVS